MDRETLLKQLTVLDFMSVDLHLFLNTHPSDAEALKMYNEVTANAAKVRCQYEEKYGPLTSYRSMGTKDWTWRCCPWPWSESFNFSMGEECL